MGWGNLRANGHPNGGPWRQLLCVVCRRYFLETLGTLFHGKRASVELIVRVIACLAEGLGIRGTARVFEVDPNTVLQWLVEAAEQLQAFSRHVLHDVRVRQVQLDELFALLSAVKDGEVSEAEAIERLERSPHWVWVAMDPESKLLLAIDVGERTLAMAQRVVHQVAQVLAPDCAPLFLTDGFREYLTALLTHYGQWVQPPRRQATGPAPKPRWMPLPAAPLCAGGQDGAAPASGPGAATAWCLARWRPSMHVLAPLGWQINTAFVERLNLTIRQHVAAVGRRVTTLCKGEDGLRQQLALYPLLLQFLPASCQLTPALAAARPDQRHGLSHAVAALYAGDGGWVDRSCLDAARGAAVPRAAVAAASGGVSSAVVVGSSQGRGPEPATCVHTARFEGSPGLRGPLGGHESPLV